MKKFLKKSLIYLTMTMLVIPATLITGALSAQRAQASSPSINEGFANGTIPENWDSHSLSFYNSSGNYSTKAGSGIYSVKFDDDNDYFITPSFSGLGKLSFWAKGVPYPGHSSISSDLHVYGYKNGGWNEIDEIHNVSTTAATYQYSINISYTKVLFCIDKSEGNIAVDDISISPNDTTSPVISGVVNNQLTNKNVTPVITDDSGSFTAKLNGSNFISGTSISDSGIYTLVATDSSSNTTTVNFVIDKVEPTAKLSYSTVAPTNQDVVVTITPDELINEVLEYTYSENGSYPINFTDLAGNPGTVTAIIENIDKNAPVITLIGPDFLVINDNSEYVEQGISVEDDVDGDITANVKTEIMKFQVETGKFDLPVENIDSAQSGIYLVAYSVQDSADNVAVEFRMVFIRPIGGALINLPVFMDDEGKITEELRSDFQENKQTMVSLFIQNGSSINGIEWDGVFNLPISSEIGAVILPVDAGYSASDVDSYEIGSGTTELVLDQPAKIVFYGKAGYRVGYIDQANIFVPINDQCVFEEGSIVPTLAEGAACKIDADKDLVVWTKHFTKFVAYTQVVTVPVISEVKAVAKDGQYFLNVAWAATGASSFKFFVNDLESSPVSVSGNTAVLKVSNTGDYKVRMKAIIGTTESVLSNEISATVKPAEVIATAPAQVVPVVSTIAPTKAKAAVNPAPASEQTVETPKDDQGIIKGEEKKDDKDETNWTPWIILFILILFAGAATGGYFYWFAGKDDDKEENTKISKVEKKADTKVTVRMKDSTSKKKSKRW